MYCRRCRYPLHDLNTQACPGCGREFDPAHPTTYLHDPHPYARRNVTVGAALFLALLVWAGLSSGGIGIFWDSWSFVWVALFVTAGLWMTAGPRDMLRALVAGLRAQRIHTPYQLARHLEILTRGYQLAWAAGIVGMFVGVATMLKNMADPSMIGPGMAVALLVVIYGSILAELGFASLRAILISRADIEPAERAKFSAWSPPMLGFGAAAVFMLIAVFFVLFLALTPVRG